MCRMLRENQSKNQFGVGNVDFAYAHQSQMARTQRSREMDESTRHKRTYTERQISRKPGLLDAWYRNPGSLDIFGIDAFGSSKTRKTRKRRGKR